ncbi:probable LRR receptor-like serine/threonine-protein kinase At1g56140 [Ziziphus jujuba]|uniref:Probable LRR receptor-like serine/threonine-protein kinase At1g56140 n=1 Tax=Ziziphus jujuba TaxID=326968 RepID=A0ABM4A2F8_ZIZJJ|nr:probable LRR receptor-like serine/threonine-protein kinase At1g56140 [Ziziphus jujuba]
MRCTNTWANFSGEKRSLTGRKCADLGSYVEFLDRVRIIHRDVKASNILLDSNLVPKISDFGLAKLFAIEKAHINAQVSGTVGYLAPEYAMRGQLNEKTDIFAFGVLTVVIVSGRPNSDMSLDEKIFLLGWVWNLNKEGRELEVVDSAITLSGLNEEQIRRVIRIALLCPQTSPSLRPTMSCGGNAFRRCSSDQ